MLLIKNGGIRVILILSSKMDADLLIKPIVPGDLHHASSTASLFKQRETAKQIPHAHTNQSDNNYFIV